MTTRTARLALIARGATIIAEVAGYGMSSDAYHVTHPPEDGDGVRRVMLAALDDASLTPAQIDYLNAHATSTQAGALEAVVTILALRDQVAPPTINLDTPDDTTRDLVPNHARPMRIRHAMTNSFGFGGTNTSLIFTVPE